MKLTTVTVKVQNRQWRVDPVSGFLRCTVTVLRVCVMDYQPDEMGGGPPDGLVIDDGIVRVFTPPESLDNAESLASLEGMPAVVGHIWQDTQTNPVACGNISGAVKCDGAIIVADVLVTDADTIRRIQLPPTDPDYLCEISSAFDADVIWERGVAPDGAQFDGYFQNIRYNHVALLGTGQGRAGASIRIINNQPKGHIMELTRVKLLNGRTVRVANEDVQAVEDNDKEAADKIKNAPDPAKMQETIDRLAELNTQMETLQKEKTTLEGQLQALKDQLDSVMSPEAVETAAAAMNAEKDDAGKVMAANSLTLTDDQKKLRGDALRTVVVNSIRVKNGKPELTAEQVKAPGFVAGMFSTMLDLIPATTAPAGHHIVNGQTVANAGEKAPVQAINSLPNNEKFAAMYGAKK